MNGKENGIIPTHSLSNALENYQKEKSKRSQFNTPLIYDNTLDTLSIENVLLIHDEIENYNSLYDNCNSNTLAIVYSVRSNSDDLNTLLKSKFSKINRLAIAFHDPGTDGYKTFLNYAWLFTPDDLKEDNKENSINMIFMINLIKEFNIENIDFMGCNTLKYDNWNSYYSLLMKESSVIVGASNDNTGNVKYGGDWIMENTYEDVKNIYFTNGIEDYSELLDTSLIEQTGIIYLRQNGVNIEWSQTTSGTWEKILFPCTLRNSNPISTSILTVKQYSDLTISSTTGGNSNRYFEIDSRYIIFDGNGYTVTISGISNYLGLIRNGVNTSGSGFSNIRLKNININSDGSTLGSNAGWIGQRYFGEGDGTLGGIVDVVANNCFSAGNITEDFSGGIFGANAGNNNGRATANNCFSSGDISGTSSGGIFGSDAGSNKGAVNATNCYSTGNIEGDYSGGIAGDWFGSNSNNLCQIINCYTTGTIEGLNSGGIVGAQVGYNNNSFGSRTPQILIQNCYTLGNISNGSGGICGGTQGSTYTNPSIVNLKNCYTIGTITANSGGIVSPNLQITPIQTNCISTNNSTWNDTTADSTLITNTSTWTDISSLETVPYLLTSFDEALYNPSSQTITSTGLYESTNGLFVSTDTITYEYFIITVNNSFNIQPSITINTETGKLTFNNVSGGTYTINVLCNVLNGNEYFNYNIYAYTLILDTGTIIGSTGDRGPIGPVGNQSKCNNIYTYLNNPSYITFYNNLYTKLYNQLYNPIYNQSYNQSYNQLYVQLYNQIYDQLSKYGNTKNLGPRGAQGKQGLPGPECKDIPIVINNPTYELLYEQLYNQLYDQLYDQLYNQLYDQLYNQLYGQLYNQLKKENINLTYSTNYVLGATGPTGYQGPQGPQCSNCSINGVPLSIFSSYDIIYDQLYNQLYDQLYDQLYVQLYNQDYNQLYEQLYNNLFNKLI